MCAGSLPHKRLQKINPIVITDRDREGLKKSLWMCVGVGVCVHLCKSAWFVLVFQLLVPV